MSKTVLVAGVRTDDGLQEFISSLEPKRKVQEVVKYEEDGGIIRVRDSSTDEKK